MNIIDEKNTLK